ncbi:histidine phosphatase family protein [Paenibacillus sp. MBLB4367]|uniref:histidine phosphatase family protein n=1 Tax=Paenibacillus sp. MBLB4367 TaxID=3384767 RepID=UPI003907EE75
MKTYVYFVRHAVSPFALHDERARGLSGEGAADAHHAAGLLASEGINVVVSSSYTRAVDTVRPLAELLQTEIVEFEELRERPIASLRYAISEDELTAAIGRSFEDIDFCMAEGETTREAQDRAIPVFKRLLEQYRGQKIAVGTHGNIMTIILQYFDGRYGFEFWKQTSKPDIYKLQFDGDVLENVERLWRPRG